MARIAEPDPDLFADALSIQLHLAATSWAELTEVMQAMELMTASLAAQRASAAGIERSSASTSRYASSSAARWR